MRRHKKSKTDIVNSFNQATQQHTRPYQRWCCIKDGMVEADMPYPIPFGKFTIDENFSRNEISIRCKKCWTDDLMLVARKLAKKMGLKVSSPISVSGFGTAYNFFTIVV